MKIEAVVTCVDYADFLAETLPLNRPHFDQLVVVTTPEDKATRALCDFWHVKCVQTDAFRRADGQFCKGAGINAGLAELDCDGWVLHLDADIALPAQAKVVLDRMTLDPHTLYGCDRFDIVGYKTWRKHLRNPLPLHESDVYVHAGAYRIATRFMWPKSGGYIPIGFFQLWNPAASGCRSYPTSHTTAGRSDMLFSQQWPRERRGFLPEIVVFHLQSENVPQGANWEGRQTAPFDYAGWDTYLNWLWRWFTRWRKHHQPDPYWFVDGAQITT